MQNGNTPPQQGCQTTEAFQLTAQDKAIVLLALGMMIGAAGLDDNRQMRPPGKEALRVARKFGVTY